MSNPYLNQILFGNSKEKVGEEYIREMLPLMLTDERMKRFHSNVSELDSPVIIPKIEPSNISVPDTIRNNCDDISASSRSVRVLESKNTRYKVNSNSLFWAIYELEHPEEAFLGTKANAEVEHRLKVVASLKTTPKRLKETNSKLTIEQTQALLGSMLVTKEDKLDFCIAYAAYYNKPIVVVYEKTYRVFSPTVDINLEEDDVILLYAKQTEHSKQTVYVAEKNPTPEITRTIVQSKIQGPLRSMTSYKTPELDELATFFQIPLKTREQEGAKEKRRKKDDVYNDVKLAIHNDMN